MSDPSLIDSLPERSEQVQEILGRPPMWMVRWGTVLVLGVILVLAYLSWMVKYPEVIRAPIVLTSGTPPIDIHAMSTGRLTQLFVRDSQQVELGDRLALLENSADWEDIQRLMHLTDSLVNLPQGIFSLAPQSSLPHSLQLGSLQEAYSRFVAAWMAFQSNKVLLPFNRERNSLLESLTKQQEILKGLQEQGPRIDRELTLAQKELDRKQSLLEEKVIPPIEVEAAERSVLEVEGRQDIWNNQLAELRLRIAEKQAELNRLNVQQPDAEIRLKEELYTAFDLLTSSLQDWERAYLLRAPGEGRVTLFSYWSTDQFVRKEEAIMTLVPMDSTGMLGKVQLPLKNSGKVNVGQRVVILLDNYPFQEFGSLTGSIDRISLVPQDASYTMDVTLPNGLLTSYQHSIPFRQELRGQAEIITEDLRLIERLLYQLRKAWRERVY